MYVHPAFSTHRAVSLAFAAARGFGLVVACDGGRPVASPLPFRLIETGPATRLEFHVARANPLAALAAKGGTWMVAVQGPDAYVSPDWYESSEQVPTWLYETVHFTGPVHLVPPAHLADHLAQLSAQFEQGTDKPPWTPAQVSPARREMLMKAVVGIEMTVETVEGNFKLNQHKSDADHVAIARALALGGDAAAAGVAARMVALRPHLSYGANETIVVSAAAVAGD
jgi:transcriptional regulator